MPTPMPTPVACTMLMLLTLAVPLGAAETTPRTTTKSRSAEQSSTKARPPLVIDPQRVSQIAALLPGEPRGVGRPLSDRHAWETLAATGNYELLLREAETVSRTPVPELPDDLYLDFSQTGNRTRYQNAAARRHQRLPVLVIAECLEHRGRFLPAIEATLQAICDEKAWTLPAHDRSLKNFKGGHNAEHHNHNDLGSFVVAVGHSAPLLDPGAEVYTARTFSSRRYESNLLNSFGHPVPRVAGQLQREGPARAAKILATEFTPAAGSCRSG